MASVEELCDDITLINRSESILSGSVEDIKKKYRTKEYEFVFTGDFNLLQATLTANYQLIEHKKLTENYWIKVKLLNDISSNQLLQTVMPCGNIVSFNEVLPDMNAIFIRVVQEQNLLVDSLN
jgi:ABC-2 type transport system ATP-binding protein